MVSEGSLLQMTIRLLVRTVSDCRPRLRSISFVQGFWGSGLLVVYRPLAPAPLGGWGILLLGCLVPL